MHYLILLLVLVSACATTSENQKRFSVATLKEAAPKKEPNKRANYPLAAVGLKKIPAEKARPAGPTDSKDVLNRAIEQATQNPKEEQFFNATMVYDWEPSALYQVFTSPNRITIIQLEAGERILAKGAGDTTRWTIGETTSGSGPAAISYVYLKPTRHGLGTNVFITTDRRLYQLEVSSHQDSYMASVTWNYSSGILVTKNTPEEEEEESLNPETDLKLEELNFNYGLVATKKPTWMPVRVFDNGKKTFIEFSSKMQAQESPALFVITDAREGELVNYRVQGNFYVLDRLIEAAELRLGAKIPQIVGIEHLN